MPADIIARHLQSVLGSDVGISFDDPTAPRQVLLYRPDRLSEDFVALALQSLEDTVPKALDRIDSVLVAFETPIGPSRRRVDFRSRGPEVAKGAAA